MEHLQYTVQFLPESQTGELIPAPLQRATLLDFQYLWEYEASLVRLWGRFIGSSGVYCWQTEVKSCERIALEYTGLTWVKYFSGYYELPLKSWPQTPGPKVKSQTTKDFLKLLCHARNRSGHRTHCRPSVSQGLCVMLDSFLFISQFAVVITMSDIVFR
jgi:hypothetical protein